VEGIAGVGSIGNLGGAIGLVVETGCNYFSSIAPIHWRAATQRLPSLPQHRFDDCSATLC
jgi:hypothetical protein